jgi:hypothetical protein
MLIIKNFFNKLFGYDKIIEANDEFNVKELIVLDHITTYLFNRNTSIDIIKNLCKLVAQLNTPLIDIWFEDWQSHKKLSKNYEKRLNVICPILLKELKRLQRLKEKEYAELD